MYVYVAAVAYGIYEVRGAFDHSSLHIFSVITHIKTTSIEILMNHLSTKNVISTTVLQELAPY